MAAHRYWRARFESPKALSLSEFQLIAGTTRVDAPATLSSNVAPASGSLANLKDDDVSTDAAWPLAKAVVLSWDFGGGTVDVSDIRLGSTFNRTGFPPVVALDWSDDGVTWSFSDSFGIILWPGYRAKTASEQLGNLFKAHGYGQGSATTQYVPTSPYLVANVIGDYGTVLLQPSVAVGVRQVEFQWASINGSGLASTLFGFVTAASIRASLNGLGQGNAGTPIITRTETIAYYQTGAKYIGSTSSAFGASFAVGDVIGATVNFSTGAVTFYKNGTLVGVAGSYPVGQPDIMPAAGVQGSSGANNSNNFAVRTRGFTYPIAGAVPWEDRYRIATHYALTSGGTTSIGKVATLAERATFAVKGLTKHPLKLARDWRESYLGVGRGRVKGTTKDKGTPNVAVSERVRLYQEIDGRLIQEQWSAPGTGAYSFDYVDELQTYTVISYDHDKAFRAVVADGLTLAGGGVEYIGAAPDAPIKRAQLRSGTDAVMVTASSINVPVPPGTVAGDMLVLILRRVAAITGTGGMALVQSAGPLSTTMYVEAYTKTATTGDISGGITMTFGASGVVQAQCDALYTSMGGSTPVYDSSNQLTAGSSFTNLSLPSLVAPAVDGCLAYAGAGLFVVQSAPNNEQIASPWSMRSGAAQTGQLVFSATRDIDAGTNVNAGGIQFTNSSSPLNSGAVIALIFKPGS